jgi:hypothetical protein
MIGNLKWVYIIIVGLVFAGQSVCLANDKPFVESLTDSVPTESVDASIDSISAIQTRKSIYALPYSVTGRQPDWHRMWINTATLSGAYISTLFVLECLPADATSWNRAEIRGTAPFKRWFKNIFKRGPEWDHDKFYFNYVLHPYAGAVYFMGARSCGFNAWQSLLYCTCISTIGWEFGIEAFMERPSIQDLFVTPLVGSAIGEGFYCIKRYIVNHDYRLLGSKFLGGFVAFLVDPVNEAVGLFAGNEARKLSKTLNITTTATSLSLVATF